MKRVVITTEEAIRQNMTHDSKESEHHFGDLSREAANYFHEHNPVGPIVDLGCGDGPALVKLAELGHSVIGVDIQKAKLDRIKGGYVLFEAGIEDWLSKRRGGRTANIFCHHVLEHLADPVSVLAEISRVMVSGGLCLMVVPKDNEPYSVHYTAFDAVEELVPPGFEVIDGGERKRDTPEFWVLSRKP